MTTLQENGRYVIDRSAYRANRGAVVFLIIWLIIWVPGTLFVTGLAFTGTDHSPFIYVWLVFAYLGAILVPYSLFSRKRKQILEVSGDSLVVHGAGILPSSKANIQKQNLKALTLEQREGVSQRESIYTLNLFKKQGFRHNRIILANFLHPEDLAILFDEIREFLQKHGFVFEAMNNFVSNEGAHR